MLIALYVIGVLVLLILLAGFTSPRITHVERRIEIEAPKDVIWEQMIDLKNFVGNWSPWSKKDPAMKQEFSGAERGLGSMYFWSGDPKKVGEGSMEIIEVDHGKKVHTKIVFKGRGSALAAFMVQDGDNGRAKVTWDFHSDNGMNPIARLFGRLMDRFMGPDFESGLKNLKSHCEK